MILLSLAIGYVFLEITLSLFGVQADRYTKLREQERQTRVLRETVRHTRHY